MESIRLKNQLIKLTTKEEIKSLNTYDYDERTDLSSVPFVTIDGEDAKDFDDAVFAQKLLDNSGWKILVSIADVSYFVKSGSYLDKEAKERGNSVYLPNLVIPMLPEELSNELCSLKPNVDRLCLTVDITLNNDGKKLSHKFFRSKLTKFLFYLLKLYRLFLSIKIKSQC